MKEGQESRSLQICHRDKELDIQVYMKHDKDWGAFRWF